MAGGLEQSRETGKAGFIKHDWEILPTSAETVTKYGWEPRRKCKNCGKIQQRATEQSWMRVIGYRWEPKVGRCQGNQTPVGKVSDQK